MKTFLCLASICLSSCSYMGGFSIGLSGKTAGTDWNIGITIPVTPKPAVVSAKQPVKVLP
jgi:hypothetical protein